MKVIRLTYVHFRSLLLTAPPPPRRLACSPPCSSPPCRRRSRRRSDQQDSVGRKETRARTQTIKAQTLGPVSPNQRSQKKSGHRYWSTWRRLAHRQVQRRPEIPSPRRNLHRRPELPSLRRNLRRNQQRLGHQRSAVTRPGFRRHLRSYDMHQVPGLRLPLCPCLSRREQRPLLRSRCL